MAFSSVSDSSFVVVIVQLLSRVQLFATPWTAARQVVIVQLLSRVQLFATPWTAARQVSLPFTPRVCSNSCPLSWWSYLIISSSVSPFSSCPQFSPASGSFPKSQLFESGGQSMGTSASVLPVSIQGWFPVGLTGLISLLSKGLSRVFSNTTITMMGRT